jgi:hypothetical protein
MVMIDDDQIQLRRAEVEKTRHNARRLVAEIRAMVERSNRLIDEACQLLRRSDLSASPLAADTGRPSGFERR